MQWLARVYLAVTALLLVYFELTAGPRSELDPYRYGLFSPDWLLRSLLVLAPGFVLLAAGHLCRYGGGAIDWGRPRLLM